MATDMGKHDWLGRSALLVLGVAVLVRMAVSLSQVAYGIHGVPWLGLSTWTDFYGGYAQWLGYIQKGLLPYRDFYAYKYTPLFIYSLYPFFRAAGAQGASTPVVAADAATALIVYLLVNTSASKRVAIVAGLLYALSPFVVYYEGYLWLSSQPMTLFILLAVYLLKEDRPVLSFAALGVSVMFKQEALFILPGYLFLYARGHLLSLAKGLGVFLAVLLGVSLPFLLVAPVDYIASLNYLPLAIPLGGHEPSVQVASTILNGGTQQGNPEDSCGLTTIVGVYTGRLCGSVVNISEFAASLVVGKLDAIANFLEPFFFVLALPLLYVSRRTQGFTQVVCAYSLLACLALYSYSVAPSLGYYFIPVYALLFASVTDGKTALLGAGIAIINGFLPEGPFQVLLPLGFIFLLAVFVDISPPHAR